MQQEIILFKPQDAYRMGGGNGRTSRTAGTNHPGGAAFNFFIKQIGGKDTISLRVFDKKDQLIKTFSNKPNKDKKETKLKVEEGNNIFYWNMMYEGAEKVKGMILWWASLNGPMALPGEYKVELTVNETSQKQVFTLLRNPVSEASQADMIAQFDFINDINEKVTEIHTALKNVKKVTAQIAILKKSISDKKKHKELIDFADDLVKKMTAIEVVLYQTKSKSGQDPLNYPIRLNNKLAHINSLTRVGNYKPTQQEIDFKNEITKKIDSELKKLHTLFEIKVQALNKKLKESTIDFIQLD